MKQYNNKKGFTLTELLVVMTIVSILTTLTLFSFRTAEKQFALQSAVYKLAQDLRRVQEMAMATREFQGEVPQKGYGVYFDISEPEHYILFADIDGDYEFNGSSEIVEDIEIEKNIRISSLSSSPLTIIFTPPDPTITIKPSADSAIIAFGSLGDLYFLLEETVSGYVLPRASCDLDPTQSECGSTFSASAEDPSFVYDWYAGENPEYQFQQDVSGHPLPRADSEISNPCDFDLDEKECPSSFPALAEEPLTVYDWYRAYYITIFVRGERVSGHIKPDQRAYCDYDENVEDCSACECNQTPEECQHSWPGGGLEEYEVLYDWCRDGGSEYSREYRGEGTYEEYAQKFVKTSGSGEEYSNRYRKIDTSQVMNVEVNKAGLIEIKKP
jgi:prepilin-type N-terminal cleavage/methylation domain-containing protein